MGMTYELDDIEKRALLGKVVERARADLNEGRPLTEMREKGDRDGKRNQNGDSELGTPKTNEV